MTIKRIVFDIAASSVDEVRAFYGEIFDLETVMNQGWVATLASGETAPAQLSIMTEGGSGAPVPDASIEVDNLDEVYARATARGCPIVYEITDEPWGVRRFFLRDPAGKVLNVLAHTG